MGFFVFGDGDFVYHGPFLISGEILVQTYSHVVWFYRGSLIGASGVRVCAGCSLG